MLALGNMHPACHALVLAESAVLAEDYPDRQMQRVSGWWGSMQSGCMLRQHTATQSERLR